MDERTDAMTGRTTMRDAWTGESIDSYHAMKHIKYKYAVDMS